LEEGNVVFGLRGIAACEHAALGLACLHAGTSMSLRPLRLAYRSSTDQ
jgi:hypothetical protein